MYYCLLIVTTYHLLQITNTLNSTSKNVCPEKLLPVDDRSRSISINAFTVKCCPNFFEKNGICEPCPLGTYGKSCLDKCPTGHFGKQCKAECNCSSFQECHYIFGCVCPAGFTGNNCDKAYSRGTFGDVYAGGCTCSMCTTCDNRTGNCTCYEHSSHPYTSTMTYNAVAYYHSSNLVQVYIGMAAAILALVCIVAATVRIKQKVCKLMRSRNRKVPKTRLQVRKNITIKSESQKRNEFRCCFQQFRKACTAV